MKINAIITAGGTSSRYGKENKLLEKINGKEVIKYSCEVFLNNPKINQVVLCANISIKEYLINIFKNESKMLIINGGNTRQQSVYNGLKELTNSDYVLIHDGARPVISNELIEQIIENVQKQKALTVATKTTDTIKRVFNGKILETLNRDELYNIQTPQAFDYNLILKAHEKFQNMSFSDDAGLVEAIGENVYILENDNKNIKITTKNDLITAKTYLSEI